MALEERPCRGSRPNFLLTGKVIVQIERVDAGSYVNGRWVEGQKTLVEVCGNVQPLRFHEVMQMPESDRTKEWIKIYSAQEMFTAQEGLVNGRQADIILWEGKKFKTMQARHYCMGVLDHWQIMAAREPVSAL